MGESERKSLRDDCIEKENRQLRSEWDDKKNEGLMPEDVSAGSRRYVWWRCKNGHSWRASVQHRSRGSGCPVCDGKITVPGDNDLLTLFCVYANETLERDYALKTIWADANYFNARSMDVYVTKLRKILKVDPSLEIKNVHGKGYRLVTPIQEISEDQIKRV